MNVDAYLKRIKFKGDLSPTLNTLSALQKAHLLSIPFENLDIHSNTEIKLELDHLYTKMILRSRGGFCYELNGLFYALLKELGFNVNMVSAQVFSKERGYGPERDHLALIVNIDGVDYLSDVGFGDFSLEPLKLELNQIQSNAAGSFSFDMFNGKYKVNKVIDEQSIPNYIFSLEERELWDFDAMCHYQQFDANSHFILKKKITKATPQGRIYLDEGKLSILENGIRTENPITSAQEFTNALNKYFNIKA